MGSPDRKPIGFHKDLHGDMDNMYSFMHRDAIAQAILKTFTPEEMTRANNANLWDKDTKQLQGVYDTSPELRDVALKVDYIHKLTLQDFIDTLESIDDHQ